MISASAIQRGQGDASMSATRNIKTFWNDQAVEFGASKLATAPDGAYRELEISQILQRINNGKSILDVGCGNGYTTIEIAKKRKGCRIDGVDFSSEMIGRASRVLGKQSTSIRKRVHFDVADVRDLDSSELIGKKKYDYVLSERCIINLTTWPEQRKGILQMREKMKRGGRMVFVENTIDGLSRLNAVRKKHGLFAMKTRWHNRYLKESELRPFLKRNFVIEEEVNIGSLYYLVSRVVYAKLASMEKKEPSYAHPINLIASELPILGNFSPNFLYVLRKK